ncbi:MAG: dynamin family protein [Elainellaceae cyanobacterium]
MNISTRLETTQTLLKDLGNALSNLVNSSPDIFTDELVQRRLQDFLKAHKESVQRLENPSLSIATIGTTSSGKSTIVNALMGRSIAPIEAGEMSGGVLVLRHSQERKLIIESTPDAVWETGVWTDLSDSELYNRIQITMHKYHESRSKKDHVAPRK